MELIIREANTEDWEYIYSLSLQLGFTLQKEKVRERLQYILNKPENKVFVAEYENSVIGYIHGGVRERIYDDKLFIIHTLVVDEGYRGKKIGHLLINTIEDWVKKNGYRAVGLLSRVDRIDAHKFYEKHEYVNERTQKYFLKYL